MTKELSHIRLAAMVKMFHSRRTLDSAQKKQMVESSAIVADIMLKHLALRDLGMYSVRRP